MPTDADITQLPVIDYTSRDFASIKEALKRHLQAKFPATWKDFYECLRADTKVPLLDGTEATLLELSQRKGPFWVYAIDPVTMKVRPAEATAKQTRKNGKLVRVHLDSGQFIDCTLDHRFMLRDGSFHEAQTLRPGDSLMPLYRQLDGRKGKMLGYEQVYQPMEDAWEYTHRLACLEPQAGEARVVHHVNFNRLDNRPENLRRVGAKQHIGLHRDLIHRLWSNPKTRAYLMSLVCSKEGLARRSKTMQRLNSDRAFQLRRDSALRDYHTDPVRLHGMIGKLLAHMQRPEVRAAISQRFKSWWSDPQNQQAMSDARHGPGNAFFGRKHTLESRARMGLAKLGRPGHKHTAATKKLLSEIHEGEKIRQKVLGANHKVSRIEDLGIVEDCYCLIVEDCGNFATSAGVFVHNSQMGMAWLELVAYTYSILSFYLDYQANESYLPTAQDRENVVKVCKLIGYRLQAPRAAGVVCTIALQATQLVDIIVPAGTKVTSLEGVIFEFLTEARVPAGDTEADATVTQGETKSDTFNSNGASFQKFLLTGTPVIDNSIVVTVNGVEWTESDSLVYGDAASEIYAVTYDVDENGNDIAYIEFGDNISGQVPVSGAVISVSYRVGGGIVGNIALNQIDQEVVGQLDGVSPVTNVQVMVTNPDERGSGGEERETAQHAKYWAPVWVKTNGRAVTEDDFDVLATRFSDATYGAVAYAKAKLRQEIPELNTVDVYIWSRDNNGEPTTPSQGLKDALQAYFDNNGADSVRIICVDTAIQDGVNLYLDIELDISALSTYATADVVLNVRQAVQDLFDSVIIQPGKDFKLSYLYRAVQQATGVEFGLTKAVKAGLKQELILGVGDGSAVSFSGTFLNLPLLESSVTMVAGALILTDDGDGNLTGDGTGTVDYTTGAVSGTFNTPPLAAVNILATSRYLKQYQRGDVEQSVTTAQARFHGKLGHAPVVPGSLAFSDGDQVVTDDGNGNLVGDISAYGHNTIDYETGSYDFMFAADAIAGASLSSTYRQYLNVDSENIPVEKWELPVLGTLSINTL